MPDTSELTAPADTTAPPEPVKITLDGPNDWLAAAAAHRVRFHRHEFGQHSRRQHARALAYLAGRAEGVTPDEVTVCRAARILLASLDAPRCERVLGIRLDDPMYDADAAAAVIPVEPTAIKPPRKRKPKAEAEAPAEATDTAAGAKAEEAQP